MDGYETGRRCSWLQSSIRHQARAREKDSCGEDRRGLAVRSRERRGLRTADARVVARRKPKDNGEAGGLQRSRRRTSDRRGVDAALRRGARGEAAAASSCIRGAPHCRKGSRRVVAESSGRLQREDQRGAQLAPAVRELAATLRRGCRRGHTGRRGKLAHLRSGAQGIGAGSADRVRRIYFGRSTPRGRAVAGHCRAGCGAPYPQRTTLCRSFVPRDDGGEVLRSTREGRADSSYER
jgi:hypothetical protein